MKITTSLVFVTIISAVALQLGSGYSIGGIPRWDNLPNKLGDECATATDCNGNTDCTPAPGPGTCTCKEGFHADDTLSCVEGDEQVGSTCKNGVGCEHLDNSECSTESDIGKCQCLKDYHPEGGKCVKDPDPTKLGDSCASATDCNGNTECTPAPGPGSCTCKEGFHADDTLICVVGGEQVDSTCNDGLGCEHLENSECSTKSGIGKCQCLKDYHNDGGKCVKDPVHTKLGDSCATATDCNGNTECTPAPGPGSCTCKEGFHADDTLICVVGDEKVNSTCKDGVGCEHIAYSECSTTSGTGTCQCSQGYSAEKDGKACVTGLHGFCKDVSNCKSPITETCISTENGTTCECKKYYKEANDTCQAPNSGICDEGGCQDPHAECVLPNKNSTVTSCICKASYKLNKEGKCTVTASKVGDYCTAGSGCNGNTECSSTDGARFCTCTDGYHADDTFSCVSGDAIIGSACTHNLGCEKVPGLKCNGTDAQGKCTCNDGFHADGEGRNCVQDVGSPCNPSVGCLDPAAECKMNQMGDYTCQCREGFEAVGNICKRMDSGLHIRVHVEEAKDIDIEIDKF